MALVLAQSGNFPVEGARLIQHCNEEMETKNVTLKMTLDMLAGVVIAARLSFCNVHK